MQTVMLCYGCDGQLEVRRGFGLVCPKGCTGPVALPDPEPPRATVLPAEDQPENRELPRWRPCGCPWSPDNYAVVRDGPTTYAGCRACLLGTGS